MNACDHREFATKAADLVDVNNLLQWQQTKRRIRLQLIKATEDNLQA